MAIPVFIEYYDKVQIIIPIIHTFILWISETLPVLLLMFSFVIFGSSTKDNLEATKERMTHFFSISRDSPKFTEVFGNEYDRLIPEQNKSNEDGAHMNEYKMAVKNINRTTDFKLDEESKGSSVIAEDFKEEDLISSSDENSTSKQEDIYFNLKFDSENNERIPTEVANREIFANALKEMMKDMGISQPSYEFSALHKNTSTIIDSSYRESKAFKPQGMKNNID